MLTMDPILKLPQNWGDGSVHIVVAEDNAITRRMIELVLMKVGWTFDSAADGAAALSAARCRAHELDLVLSDIRMPKMSGIDLVKSMKGIPSLSCVPVVLMGTPEQESEARAVRCSAFLAKPFSPTTLLDVLNI